jgi:FAD linked oxidases, C-terminal domain
MSIRTGRRRNFTFHAVGRHGELSAQWHTIKSAGLDAVIANGGTVTHHHAIGRDHRQWYDRQRPPLFAAEPTLYAVLQVPFSQWQAGGSKFFIEIFQAVGVTAA